MWLADRVGPWRWWAILGAPSLRRLVIGMKDNVADFDISAIGRSLLCARKRQIFSEWFQAWRELSHISKENYLIAVQIECYYFQDWMFWKCGVILWISHVLICVPCHLVKVVRPVSCRLGLNISPVLRCTLVVW